MGSWALIILIELGEIISTLFEDHHFNLDIRIADGRI